QRNEVARRGIRIGVAELLALGVVDRLDAGGLQSETDRVVAGRAVRLLRGQDRGNGLRVLDDGAGVAGSAEFGEVERAAEQTLDNDVIVGSREQRNLFETEGFLQVVGEASVVAQAVSFVFATENTNAEFLDVPSGSAASEREKRRGCEKGLLQHGFVS